MKMGANTLHESVKIAACRHSARTAVKFDSCGSHGCMSLTYSELHYFANELTNQLKKFSPLKERIFGLYCQPGINVPNWIMGILQVPGAYVPLDPDAPPLLSVKVIEMCGLEYAVIQSDLLQTFQNAFSSHMSVKVCEAWQSQNLTLVQVKQIAPESQNHKDTPQDKEPHLGETAPAAARESTDQSELAYVLHTSGTTGSPKIVRVQHQCILPNILHLRSLFQITENDVVFMASPLTFDPSVVEMFLALSSGACLLMVPKIIKMIPKKLSTVLFRNHRTTVIQATPTLMGRFGRNLLQNLVLSAASSLRILALGGEPCPPTGVLRSWRKKGNITRIFNLYGITEVSCWACWHEVPEDQLAPDSTDNLSVPLGRPLMGTAVEVRDETGSVITQGEGQVFIGGKIRVCFLDDEVTVAPGTMRCTGDWVELRNSHLYFLGRKDQLIKRNGQRLHLDAVRQALQGLSEVEACAVTLYEGRLLAFVVPASPHGEFGTHPSPPSGNGSNTLLRELQRGILNRLSQLLPAYGIPDRVMMLPTLPTSPHGKVAIDELLKLYVRLGPVCWSARPGSDEVAEKLQTLWKEALGLAEDAAVSADSHFLFSGGDSLRCLRLCSDITAALGVASRGLMEVILNGSFAEVVAHVTTAAFPSQGSKPEKPEAKKEIADPSSLEPANKRLPTDVSSQGPDNKRLPTDLSSPGPANKRLPTDLSSQGPANKRLPADLSSPGPANKRLPADLSSPGPANKRPPTDLSSQGPANKRPPTEHCSQEHGHERLQADFSSIELVNKRPSIQAKPPEQHFCPPLLKKPSAFVVVRRAGEVLEMGNPEFSLSCSGEVLYDHGNNHLHTAGPSPGVKEAGGSGHQAAVPRTLGLQVRWMSDTGRCVDASAVLLVTGPDQATVYVGSHSHRLQAVDLSSGILKWERVLGGRIEASAAITRCGGFIAVGCYDGQVYFLCADTGETHWAFQTGDSIKSSPAVDPLTGLVLVGSHDGNIYALHLEAQRCMWKRPCGGGGVFSSPCLHSPLRQLYVATLGGRLLSLNADSGALLWTQAKDTPFFSSPACSSGCVCIGSVDGSIYGFSHSGKMLWQFSTSGPVFSSPCVTSACTTSQKVVCGSHDGGVYCLDSEDGSLLWRFQTTGRVFSCPFLLDGAAWGCGSLVAICSTDGTLWVLGGEDGEQRASLSLPGELFSSPVAWGRSLVVGCRNDIVYCLELTNQQDSSLGSLREPGQE